jgi:ketosteroid isomerase-like protein
MTSSPNLDLVRALYAAWEHSEFTSTEWAHPDIEWVIADGPAPGTWTGLATVAEGFRDFLGVWEAYRVEAEQYRELNDERILVLHHLTGRGKTSGLDIAQTRTQGASLFQIRSGKVTKLVQYWDAERALADLGLASETGPS